MKGLGDSMARGKREAVQVVGQLSLGDFSTDLSSYVAQSDTLITAKQSLKLNSAKLVRAAIKQITPEDKEFMPYIITVSEIAEMLNISPSNLYKDIWDITDDILENPIQIKKTEGKKVIWSKIPWVKRCDYHPDLGLVIKLNDELKPLLLNLQKEYKYTYDRISSMKSIYSLRIYEIINSHIGPDKLTEDGVTLLIKVADLKESCNCEDKYKEFSNFRMRILDNAVREINEFSQYTVSYIYLKEGRKVKFLEFLVKPKN